MTRLILAVAGIMVLGGCREADGPMPDDSAEEHVMFGAYVSSASGSRAYVADLNRLKSTGFGVFAIESGSDDFNPDASAGLMPAFMCNQKVSWYGTGNAGAWSYEPKKSWGRAKLSFFAYAPYSEAVGETGIVAVSGPQDAGSPRVKFRLDDNVGTQIDLLYADASQTVNLVNKGEVKFVFNHALSRVGFSCAASAKLPAETRVTVNRVVLKSSELGVAGELDLFSGKWLNIEPAEMAYALTAADSDFITGNNIISAAQGTYVARLTANGKYLMLIPSEDEVAVELTIDYDVTTADDRLESGSVTVSNSVTSIFNHKFEAGKAYDFTLRIGLNAVEVGVGLENWENWDYDWLPTGKKK